MTQVRTKAAPARIESVVTEAVLGIWRFSVMATEESRTELRFLAQRFNPQYGTTP